MQRFELAKALGRAHWNVVRFGDATAANRLQTELRNLARRAEATEGQRWVLAEALANEVHYHGGPRGDAERVERLMKDLRRLAGRVHSTEAQRSALVRALAYLHHAARQDPKQEPEAVALLEALSELAGRSVAPAAQRLSLVEALIDVPSRSGRKSDRNHEEALLAAILAAERQADTDARQRVLLGDALVRAQAKVRRHREDGFADRLLDRLRAMSVNPDATIEEWLALSIGLCDGLWIAGTFANRDLAEELVEVLTLLTGDVEATARQRIHLAGLLVGAHHRAVRSKDSLLSKALLTLLHRWAVRSEASREERFVLGHGLRLALEHARELDDQALVAKVQRALEAAGSDLEPSRADWGGGALQDLAVEV